MQPAQFRTRQHMVADHACEFHRGQAGEDGAREAAHLPRLREEPADEAVGARQFVADDRRAQRHGVVVVDLAEVLAATVEILGVGLFLLWYMPFAPVKTQSVLTCTKRAPATWHSRASRCGSSALIGIARSGSSASASCFTRPMQLMTTSGRTCAKSRARLSTFSTSTPVTTRSRSSAGAARASTPTAPSRTPRSRRSARRTAAPRCRASRTRRAPAPSVSRQSSSPRFTTSSSNCRSRAASTAGSKCR